MDDQQNIPTSDKQDTGFAEAVSVKKSEKLASNVAFALMEADAAKVRLTTAERNFHAVTRASEEEFARGREEAMAVLGGTLTALEKIRDKQINDAGANLGTARTECQKKTDEYVKLRRRLISLFPTPSDENT